MHAHTLTRPFGAQCLIGPWYAPQCILFYDIDEILVLGKIEGNQYYWCITDRSSCYDTVPHAFGHKWARDLYQPLTLLFIFTDRLPDLIFYLWLVTDNGKIILRL